MAEALSAWGFQSGMHDDTIAREWNGKGSGSLGDVWKQKTKESPTGSTMHVILGWDHVCHHFDKKRDAVSRGSRHDSVLMGDRKSGSNRMGIHALGQPWN